MTQSHPSHPIEIEIEIPVEIPVVVSHEDSLDERVKNVPPPWLRMAQRAVHVGSLLLVIAVILFTAVVAEKLELMQSSAAPPPVTPNSNPGK